jgi:hypothetical protein
MNAFIKHLHAVSHNLLLAELLERRDQLLGLYHEEPVSMGDPVLDALLARINNVVDPSLLQQIRDAEDQYLTISERLRAEAYRNVRGNGQS